MKIIIKTKNFDLTAPIEKFVEEKFMTLKKFINVLKREDEIGKTLAEVFVEVGKVTKHHKKGEVFFAEAQIRLPGRSLSASATSDDLFKAIVSAKGEMEAEIEKYKTKKIDKNRRQQRKMSEQVDVEE